MFRKPINPAIVCADGFSMSVQASARHRCTPREDWGPYTAMEIGGLSDIEPLIAEFQHEPGWNPPTMDVYNYVPVAVIEAVIAKHGGIVKGKLPPHTKPTRRST